MSCVHSDLSSGGPEQKWANTRLYFLGRLQKLLWHMNQWCSSDCLSAEHLSFLYTHTVCEIDYKHFYMCAFVIPFRFELLSWLFMFFYDQSMCVPSSTVSFFFKFSLVLRKGCLTKLSLNILNMITCTSNFCLKLNWKIYRQVLKWQTCRIYDSFGPLEQGVCIHSMNSDSIWYEFWNIQCFIICIIHLVQFNYLFYAESRAFFSVSLSFTHTCS